MAERATTVRHVTHRIRPNSDVTSAAHKFCSVSARLILVHSPLVGPGTWKALSVDLAKRGQDFSLVDLTQSVSGDPPYVTRQIDAIVASVTGDEVILVGHSGAGPLLAAAGERIAQLVGYIFVDAGMPHPSQSWMDVVPPELATRINDMARNQWLPSWSKWWGPDALLELLPDAEIRDNFINDCPELPLAMFLEKHPAISTWPNAPGAYLLLSEPYIEAATQAEGYGWPVVTKMSNHLALLSDPHKIVGPLVELARQLQ